jgi:hypothetical protein
MLDDETFAGIAASSAREYAYSANPTDYDAFFPKYLRSLGHLPSIEYLADVAELEFAYWKAGHATAAATDYFQALSKVCARLFDRLSVEFNASVSILSSRFPIVTVWENNRCGGNRFLPRWGPEAALVFSRSGLAQIVRLSASEFAFLTALSRRTTVADAIAKAKAVCSDFELGTSLVLLIDSSIVSGLHDHSAPCQSVTSPVEE